MSGLFSYPDRELIHELPFFNPERISLLKKRLEADGKAYFYEGWVWMPNFQKHNYFYSPQQQFSIYKQLSDTQRRCPHVITYFQRKGFIMPTEDEYLQKRRRNFAKKEVRKQKPWLMGAKLEQEVDRVLGIADSGVMDWKGLADSGKPASQYGTPESIIPKLPEVAKQFALRQWVLYWFFKKKIYKLEAGGRKKSDYLAVLKDIATKVKPLSRDEKIQALMLFSTEVRHETLTAEQADFMIDQENL